MSVLKVYGVTESPPPLTWGARSRTVRVVVAATSQAKAVAALNQAGLNTSVSSFRKYGSQTWNDVQIEVASARPGTVFWAEDHHARTAADYHPVEATT